MTDPRALLDAYANEQWFIDSAGLVRTEDLAPNGFAGLRAVLDLHHPVDRGAGPQCAGCATHVTFTDWPCLTVQAITRELERADIPPGGPDHIG